MTQIGITRLLNALRDYERVPNVLLPGVLYKLLYKSSKYGLGLFAGNALLAILIRVRRGVFRREENLKVLTFIEKTFRKWIPGRFWAEV